MDSTHPRYCPGCDTPVAREDVSVHGGCCSSECLQWAFDTFTPESEENLAGILINAGVTTANDKI